MKKLYKTKHGFGGLFKAGIVCFIWQQDGENVVVRTQTGDIMHGKLTDLEPINPN